MKPTVPITDPAFKYTSSAHTDIRKTFARARKQMREQAEAEAARRAAVVVTLRERGKP